MLDVLVVGAGPTGLFAADHLALTGLNVSIVDRMSSPARKFLMAGRGGLNLTHSEDLSRFKSRYREAENFLSPFIDEFSPENLKIWCHELGQETFIGSSGRVFPKQMKASPLLRALLARLQTNKVSLKSRLTWTGSEPDGTSHFLTSSGSKHSIAARATLLTLGGASWPRLGSNGAWTTPLNALGIRTTPFRPANCGFIAPWSNHLTERFAGSPLKRIAFSLDDSRVLGEALISSKGLEGSAIYALSAEIRTRIEVDGSAEVMLDLTPQYTLEQITQKLSLKRRKQSLSTYLRKSVGLSAVELCLLRENGPLPETAAGLAETIKAVPVRVTAPYEIDRAISSAGGIDLDEVDGNLMLKQLPGVFVAGEMLDWEAPTGGYLLQACFSMGHHVALGISTYLSHNNLKASQ